MGYSPAYFNRYAYAGNNPTNMIDPNGEAWGLASKAFKVLKNGGDIAATIAGAAADFKTITSGSATLKTRLLATASLGSEIFSPVSARDAKAISRGASNRLKRVGDKGTSTNLKTPNGNSHAGNSTGSTYTGGNAQNAPYKPVEDALANVPAGNRSPFHGKCCEMDAMRGAGNAGDGRCNGTCHT